MVQLDGELQLGWKNYALYILLLDGYILILLNCLDYTNMYV